MYKILNVSEWPWWVQSLGVAALIAVALIIGWYSGPLAEKAGDVVEPIVEDARKRDDVAKEDPGAVRVFEGTATLPERYETLELELEREKAKGDVPIGTCGVVVSEGITERDDVLHKRFHENERKLEKAEAKIVRLEKDLVAANARAAELEVENDVLVQTSRDLPAGRLSDEENSIPPWIWWLLGTVCFGLGLARFFGRRRTTSAGS